MTAAAMPAQEDSESEINSEEDGDSDQEHWEPDSHTMDSKVQTSLKRHTNKQMEGISRERDRSDRATVETVLDPRTRMVRPPRTQDCNLLNALSWPCML